MFYSLRFYSRPFLDVLYVIQYYVGIYGGQLSGVSSATNGAASSSGVGRRLNEVFQRILSNSKYVCQPLIASYLEDHSNVMLFYFISFYCGIFFHLN